jgi:hypothetical protein
MLKLRVKLTLIIILVLFVIGLAWSDAGWLFNKNATISQPEFIGSPDLYNVYRIIDYQTGKIIYTCRTGICVTDLKQK